MDISGDCEYCKNKNVFLFFNKRGFRNACLQCVGPASDATPEGRKYDADKPRMDLLPFDALIEVAKVMGVGAEKYGDDNWRLVEPATRYEAALLRHYTAYKSGEINDPETGLPHLAHMATNALFILARSKK